MQPHARTRAHAHTCVCVRAHVCGFVCVRATRVSECGSVSVRVALTLSVFACAQGCLRASARFGGYAAASMRMCGVHVRVCVRVCARIDVRVQVRVCACAREPFHADVRVRVRVLVCRSIGKHLRARVSRVRACAERLFVRASALSGRCGDMRY